MRLRRSIGWANVYNTERTNAVLNSDCDAITLDLEDGVALARKAEARPLTAKMLLETDFHGKERIVRVNDVHSPYYADDMREVIAVGLPDAVRVPKCEYVKDVLMVDAQLAAIEAAAGLAPNSIEIIAMIESPIGVRNGYDIATCCERVTALNFGMEDFHREMGVTRRYTDNELDFIYARQKMVLDAKAAGVQAIDSVLLLVGDPEASHRQSQIAAQMGFSGRSVHNAEQAAAANAFFSPSPEALADAKAIVEVYEREVATNPRPPQYKGKNICYAAYERAVDIVAFAEQIRESEEKRKG